MSSQPLIQIEAAGVRFGAVTALADVDFALWPGDRVALVGSNGSGKTTLLRLLHGQLDDRLPDPARRRVGRLPSGQPPRQAMVFQRPFVLRLSVWHNLMIGLWLAGVPRPQRAERARQALRRVGLHGLERRPARVLSGGQQQRLALARAWAAHPDLLFLDEPTASLDPVAKREVEALIGEFADEGMTVVMSTHNLGQAKRLATRVVYLEAGRVVVDRPTRTFFDADLPEPAAAFLKGEMAWR